MKPSNCVSSLPSRSRPKPNGDKLAAVLEQNGIELDTSDPDSIDVAAIEELAQDYPDLWQTAGGHRPQVAEVEQPAQPAINPVQAALQAVPDLVSWREKDQDRFDFAIIVDEKLQADPAWQGKSLMSDSQRRARRTKLAFVMRLPSHQGTRQGGGETLPISSRPALRHSARPSCRPHWSGSALAPCLRPNLSERWAP